MRISDWSSDVCSSDLSWKPGRRRQGWKPVRGETRAARLDATHDSATRPCFLAGDANAWMPVPGPEAKIASDPGVSVSATPHLSEQQCAKNAWTPNSQRSIAVLPVQIDNRSGKER